MYIQLIYTLESEIHVQLNNSLLLERQVVILLVGWLHFWGGCMVVFLGWSYGCISGVVIWLGGRISGVVVCLYFWGGRMVGFTVRKGYDL